MLRSLLMFCLITHSVTFLAYLSVLHAQSKRICRSLLPLISAWRTCAETVQLQNVAVFPLLPPQLRIASWS